MPPSGRLIRPSEPHLRRPAPGREVLGVSDEDFLLKVCRLRSGHHRRASPRREARPSELQQGERAHVVFDLQLV